MALPTQLDYPSTSSESLDTSSSYKEAPPAVSNSVKLWTKRIKAARNHWKDDFDRMRENMEFADSFQWQGQLKMDDERYIANIVNSQVNQKVAALYAKDPKISAKRRRRLDFQIWDGRMETLQQAAAMMAHPEADPVMRMQATALIADFTRGRQQRDLIDRVGATLENVYSWMVECQQPSFKVQAKQMVRRVVTTGVGYVRLDFERTGSNVISTTEQKRTTGEVFRRAANILDRLQKGELQEDAPEIVDVQLLLASINESQAQEELYQEKLVFDFPQSTSIIVDPACRALKGFIGARWIAQEYMMSIDEINEFFDKEVTSGGDSGTVLYNQQGTTYSEEQGALAYLKDDLTIVKPLCCLWQVFDITTKSTFFIVDGCNYFLQDPATVFPQTKRFWPIFALTFNDVEIEPGTQKATIFPPSDVQLMKSPQKERNRSRQALREHRNANAPKYMTGKGWLTEDDKDSIINATPNAVIELQGAQPGEDINKKMAPFQHAVIDPALYDTTPLDQDIQGGLGNEEVAAPSSTKGTATTATINEQSRIMVTSSNVDDLDDLLTDVAKTGGEILFRECSSQTVVEIAGPGAVWPEGPDVEQYVNYVELEVEAASSGKPNKALEIANFTQLAPLLMQAGANPHFMVREGVKRLDDRLDVDEAFQLGGMSPMQMTPQPVMQQGGGNVNPHNGVHAPAQANQLPGQTQPKVNKPSVPNQQT
jgi:hypothetical protein